MQIKYDVSTLSSLSLWMVSALCVTRRIFDGVWRIVFVDLWLWIAGHAVTALVTLFLASSLLVKTGSDSEQL